MSVFVAGATGVLGKRLVERLVDRGFDVVGLVRDDAGERLVADRGGEPRRGDVLDPDSLDRAVPADVDAIVHGATAVPTSEKPTGDDWTRNDRVRRDGARNLVAVAGDDADRFYFPSVVWVARQPDGSRFDETDDRHPDRATRSAAETEDLLREAGAERGFDVCVLRLGFLYGPDAAHTRQFADLLLAGDMPVIGGGVLGRRDAALSLIHADDAGRALAAAVAAQLDGLYHVVDEEPVAVADLLTALADRLDAPSPRRIPGWLARFFVGSETASMLTSPFPTSANRYRDAVDWDPEYPTYREGLDQVVGTWERDGTLAELRGDDADGPAVGGRAVGEP